LVAVSLLPVVGLLYYLWLGSGDSEGVGEEMSYWVRSVGTFVACGLLLGVAVRAAGSISGEHDRRTLDSLLTTPEGGRDILAAKWLGSMAGVRWGLLWLALIGAIGVASKALDLRALPGLATAWLVYACFLAGLGLWFSAGARSTHRAILGTLAAVAAFGAGHWLLWFVWLPLLSWFQPAQAASGGLIEFEALGLTPTLTLAVLASPPSAAGGWSAPDWALMRVPIFRGLILWAAGAVVLWFLANWRFRRAYGIRPANVGTEAAPGWHRPTKGLAGLAFLGLVAWLVTRGETSADRLAAAIAEADRLDPGWRIEAIEARRRVIPDQQNSGLLVPSIPDERNSWRLPRWHPGKRWPSLELEQQLEDIPTQVRLSKKQTLLLREELRKVERSRVEARVLADYPWGRYPMTYAKDGFSTLLPYAQRNRTIANLLGYDVLLLAQEGDWNGALRSCRAMVNCGRALRDEPFLISQLVRMACLRLALAKAERVLAQGEPSEGALASLQEQLTEEEKEPILLIGMRGDRAMRDQFMVAVQTGQLPLLELWRNSQGYYELDLSPLDALLFYSGISVASCRANLLQLTNEEVEIVKGPPEEQQARLQALAAHAPEWPAVVRKLTMPRPRQFLLTQRMSEIYRRNWALLRSTIVALAAERYRRAHGRWPASLDALVPDFLPQVLRDPYDGQPLRMRRLDNGIVIYSIGPDGEDNGGTINRSKSYRYSAEEKGYDMGIRLWEVPKRAQAWPAPAPNPLLGTKAP
jgi:hypothetical protein